MMAIESPEREALAAQRAELDTVLRSEQFMRAPTLAHLLTYLCGKLFAGEAHEVKEYSVGVEVFHRGEAFDQNTDSIVRVEANRLRKRLAAYYAGEGAPNPLHITIPLGQYVPQFLPRQVEAAMAVVAQSPVAQERVAPEPPVRRFQFSGRVDHGRAGFAGALPERRGRCGDAADGKEPSGGVTDAVFIRSG
jgi:hypothetical protein